MINFQSNVMNEWYEPQYHYAQCVKIGMEFLLQFVINLFMCNCLWYNLTKTTVMCDNKRVPSYITFRSYTLHVSIIWRLKYEEEHILDMTYMYLRDDLLTFS